MGDASSSSVDVSIVSVNYKVADLQLEMIRSVPAAAGPLSYETVIVDNASNDGGVEALRALGSEIQLIESSKNLGFAGGNNLGADAARGQYLALVNPDVVLEPGALAHLVDFLRARPRAGMVGPKIVLPDGTVQSFAGRLPDSWDAVRALPGATRVERMLQRWMPSASGSTEPVRCGVIHGSCMVLSRTAWDAIGGMPTDTFMYGEEQLLGHRLERAGYEVWYDPRVGVRHDHESSANKAFASHPKALRKRHAHIVVRAAVLPRASFLAWNGVLATRDLASCLVSRVIGSGEARERWDFVRLHASALSASRTSPPPPPRERP
jgi:GT2 family glycosyltransferase